MKKNTYNRAKEIQDLLMNIQSIEDTFKSQYHFLGKEDDTSIFCVEFRDKNLNLRYLPVSSSLTNVILESLQKTRKALEEEFERL